eukprot:CAMPEP_0197576356 /NCGR_PEP_ID=MMETSP1326-20131121/1397_1 /TAXON_ID=1155430 /ORGANISM="Genus nov. species nov., Strain RCC2288" /LENGTH=194 /DNA_ID=CAMNT_0043139253 /DNA_START=32 /DNA_END=616 /DNA_ORIENTATION=-
MAACAASSVAFRVAPRVGVARKANVTAKASRGGVVRVAANAEYKTQFVAPKDVKEHLDKGFTLVDIRSPEELNETGYKAAWKNIVLAIMDEDGEIQMNPNFLNQFRKEFPNSMSRILIACDDGSMRSEKASKAVVTKLGLTNVKVIQGGIDAYIEMFPLTKADKIKYRMADNGGDDLSTLVTGVDTRQPGQKFY